MGVIGLSILIRSRKSKSRRRNDVSAQKVILQISPSLLKRADHWANQLQTNRSNFIRVAVEEKAARHERERIGREIQEGFAANAEYYATAIERFAPPSPRHHLQEA